VPFWTKQDPQPRYPANNHLSVISSPGALTMLSNLEPDVIKPASDNGSFMLGHYL
jgi:hypothetical protein